MPDGTPARRWVSSSCLSGCRWRSSSSSRWPDLRHLFVTNDFPPKIGGIESYLVNLCKGFDPEDVAVVAPTREGWEDADDDLPYQVIRYPKSYIRGSRAAVRWLSGITSRLDPDVVHFLTALPAGRLGPRLRKRSGVPFTVVAHGTGDLLLPARLLPTRLALRRVLASADLVFCVSEFTKGEVARISKSRARTSLLPPSVDIDRFSLDVSGAGVRSKHSLGGRFVVLFVSRLVKRKGADTLMRAVRRVEGVVALIGGTGPERASLERLARELGISDRVVFAGEVPDHLLASYYAAADAFCMPCTGRFGGLDVEGFGVVYLEAQASGLPCIAGHHGGSAEAVDHEVTGIVLTEPSPVVVADALRRLAEDPALCASFGGAGRERMEREFAPQRAAASLEEAAQELVSEPPLD